MSPTERDRAEGALWGLFCVDTSGRDLEMACRLADSLVTLGRFDVDDVARRYEAVEGGEVDGRALARTAPIGVFFRGSRDGAERRRASIEDAAITDHDVASGLACAAFNGAVAAAIASDRPDAAYVISAARADLDEAARAASGMRGDRDVIDLACRSIHAQLTAASRGAPDVSGDWLRDAFSLAFWELVHAPSWEAGVADADRRGDPRATGIVGALLGARWGRSGIPADRIARVLDGPAVVACHPRTLLAVVR